MSYSIDTLYRLRTPRASDPGRLAACCYSCGVKFTPGRGRPMPDDCPTCGRTYQLTASDRAAVDAYNESLEAP